MAVQPEPEKQQIPNMGLVDDTVSMDGSPMVPLCSLLSTDTTQVGCVETGCAWFNTMVGACWIADACLAIKKIAKVL